MLLKHADFCVIFTHYLEVIWYSWSSNWGADFYGGVRISLPDPASSSIIQGYTQYPNGTLAVDYPEVVLVKLIKKTLFQIPGDVKFFLFFFGVLGESEWFGDPLHGTPTVQAKRWGLVVKAHPKHPNGRVIGGSQS